MKQLITLFAIAFLAGFYMTATSDGAAYIKFDGVDGEALDKDHQGWCDLLSFSQALHKPGGGATGATRRRGDVVLEDIVAVKEVDKATPKITEAVCKGKVFPTVEIDLTATGRSESETSYYIIELKNVLVTSHMVNGSAATDERALEQISLNFEEIKVTYIEETGSNDPDNPDGTVEHTVECKQSRGRTVSPIIARPLEG